jgi:alpha-mannosidase
MSLGPQQPHIHVIATQHLDVAYLWRRHPEGEELMRQCLQRAVDMIEAYPDARFLFSRSTAWSYHVIEREFPGLFRKVAEYIDQRRIELCGGQWVEPDVILPDGETLVRQSLYGQGYYRDRFGRQATVAWNPDAFAHSHTLPQILAKSGLEAYYFHRCQPLDRDGRGITQFIWEGLDGSRVFVFSGKWRGRPDAGQLHACAAEMEETGLPMAFLVTGANSDRRVTMEVDWIPALQRATDEVGAVPARWAFASDVVRDMRSHADRLPLVVGELGFQFTGTYTSEGNIKRHTRYSEALLTDAEKACACAALLGYAYPQAGLTAAWRDLCVNAFHDIVCGTCYQHVHEEALELFRDIEAQGQGMRDDALCFIAGRVDTRCPEGARDGQPLLVYNTLSWDRRAPVVLRDLENARAARCEVEIVADDGTVLPLQRITLEDGAPALVFVPAEEVPALAYARFYVRAAPHARAVLPTGVSLLVEAGRVFRLENAVLIAQIDHDTGALCRLYDKVHGVELLAPGTTGNRLVLYGDHTELSGYEPWYIGYTGDVLEAWQGQSACVVENGPVRACVRVVRQASLDPDLPRTEIVQDIVLYRDMPYLLFQTRGDWQAKRSLLKAEFDLSFSCTRVACEMPYGVAEREPHLGQAAFRISQGSAQEDDMRAGTAVPEPDRPMQRWLDFSDGTVGVAFLNNGKYGYDASPRQVRLSLMRAPVHRDGELVGLGRFAFSYALMPHRGDWREAHLPQRGYGLNHELLPISAAPHDGPALENVSCYRIQDPGVLITVVKRAQGNGSIILRLYESLGRSVSTTLTSAVKIAYVLACDLLEAPLADGGCCRQVSGRAVEVALQPFEIVTLLLSHTDEP